MLKFNSVIILMILCEGGIQLINGEALQCQFKDLNYFGPTFYSCSVSLLENPNDNKIITGYNGVHQSNRNDKDVKQILISDKDTKYIPADLGSLFNLKGLAIYKSELIEITSKDFRGMQNLEYLCLSSNKLTFVPSDTFSTLPKIKDIYLWSNQIKYIGSGAFDQLMNLNILYLQSNICVNKHYVGASAITKMKKDIITNCKNPDEVPATTTTTTTTTQNPMEVELDALKNEAKDQQQMNEIELNKLRDDLKKEQSKNRKVKIEKDAWIEKHDELKMELNNKTEISEMKEKEDVKLNEVNGTKQNQEDLKKMMEQLLKESKENQMECQDIIKLRAELVTAKDQQKTAQDGKDQLEKKLTEELTDLKMELTKAKETIDQKLPKMEQLIEDFYMEVMDLKIERHNERQNSIALRSKLMDAKERMAECEIYERSLI